MREFCTLQLIIQWHSLASKKKSRVILTSGSGVILKVFLSRLSSKIVSYSDQKYAIIRSSYNLMVQRYFSWQIVTNYHCSYGNSNALFTKISNFRRWWVSSSNFWRTGNALEFRNDSCNLSCKGEQGGLARFPIRYDDSEKFQCLHIKTPGARKKKSEDRETDIPSQWM